MPQNLNHSDDIEEILSRPPSWTLKWGLFSIFILLAMLCFCTCFISYSDTISGSFVLTSEKPPVNVQSNSAGRIDTLLVKDGDHVVNGQTVLIVSNPCKTKDVYLLNSLVDMIVSNISDTSISANSFGSFIFKRLQIGEMQPLYTELSSIISDHIAYNSVEDFAQKQSAVSGQIEILDNIVSKNYKQKDLLVNRLKIEDSKFKTDSLLFSKQVISKLEYESSRTNLIQNQYNKESNLASFLQTELQRSSLRKEKIELSISHKEKNAVYLSSILKKCNEIKDAIAFWEFRYVIKSPISGIVHLFNLKANQNIKSGIDVFIVSPSETGSIVAEMKLPLFGSAKVKVGQKVVVRLLNYPADEYGEVLGSVKEISVLPKDSTFIVSINFPNGLKTNTKKELKYSPLMSGSAEIITEKRTLFDRILGNLHVISGN
jgi:hypothetical protein